jgi:CRISPR-associated protein (TIGR02584 family)
MDVPPQLESTEKWPRHVLLAVTGLSPQIVTETLYALAVASRPAWVPTEIQIITTRTGEEKARLTLLSDDPGWFRRLCEDYRLPEIAFGKDNIRVITGPDGEPLDDILTDADNVAVADFITETVREITADPMASLHVSIAGGRKTMGFYVGYVLSLFGRPQDRLSHVLVSPPFESLSEFFYPAPRERVIHDRNDRVLDAKDAQVHLGDIPFVRLRDGLPKRLLQGGARFSEAVGEAQKALPPLSLRLDPATQTVVASDQAFALEPMHFALYWMMAERRQAECGGVSRSDYEQIGQELLKYYGRLNPNPDVYERIKKAYRGFTEANFDQTKTKVNRALRRALDDRRAPPYLIVKLDQIGRTRLHRYGLSLPPEAITISASLPDQHGSSSRSI